MHGSLFSLPPGPIGLNTIIFPVYLRTHNNYQIHTRKLIGSSSGAGDIYKTSLNLSTPAYF